MLLGQRWVSWVIFGYFGGFTCLRCECVGFGVEFGFRVLGFWFPIWVWVLC